MSYIEANGTKIYYELRGHGPAVLFISGATGDAGHWTGVGETLADAYTVISYDRRGNSRSPSTPAWTMTTIEEQADDAAALLLALHPARRPCSAAAPVPASESTWPSATRDCWGARSSMSRSSSRACRTSMPSAPDAER